MKLKLSKYILVVPIPAFKDKPDADRLLFSTRSGKILRLSAQFLSILQEGAFNRLPDKLAGILLNNEILVPEDEAETTSILTRNLLRATDEREQSVVIRLQAPATANAAFYTSLREEIAAALSAMPVKHIKGFKYTVRLLLVLQDSINWNWLPELDARLKEWQQTLKTQFLLQVLAVNEACNELVLPRLQSTILNKLYFVFTHLQDANGTAQAAAVLASMQEQLQQTSAASPTMLNGVLVAPGMCWEHWDDTFVSALHSFSVQKNVHLEFIADEQEAALMYYLVARQIKGNWLPSPQHRYYSTAGELDLLHADISWDSEDIRCMLARQFPDAGKVYYDTDYVKYLTATDGPCQNCLYLPICGGHANKQEDSIEDCPLFIRQLSGRIAAGAGVLR